MQREFWLERWRSGQIGFHQREVHEDLQARWSDVGVARGGTVLVPLCGKSLDMLWLRAQGHPVIGVELSPLAVRGFFDENGLLPRTTKQGAFERWEAEGVTLLCGDVFALTPADLPGVAGVYDRAALIALPRELRARYVAKLMEVVPGHAATLLITLEYPPHEMEGPPFSVPEDEVRRLYGPAAEVTLLSSHDVLADEPRFRQRGLTRLEEHVLAVRRRRG